ncbi:anti-sigma factor [Microbacterium sp. X-17]|uniref:anti-sigma factor n=1 Tax=Microbacterium sp. X-17 TaxID=3144404 RepID=UPI0031F5891D
MNEQDFAVLSAGHALGALDPADAGAFAAARRDRPDRDAQVRHDEETAALLAEATPPVDPPAGIREALLAAVAEPATRPRRARGRGPRMWWVLAASIVLVAAAAVGVTVAVQQATRPAAVVALENVQAAADARSASAPLADGGTATLHWSVSVGEAVLVTDGLPAIASDQTFELWYVRGDAPIPAGTFDAGSGSATALLNAGMVPGDVIAVTVEPAGGSPTGQPTSAPIVAIPTA